MNKTTTLIIVPDWEGARPIVLPNVNRDVNAGEFWLSAFHVETLLTAWTEHPGDPETARTWETPPAGDGELYATALYDGGELGLSFWQQERDGYRWTKAPFDWTAVAVEDLTVLNEAVWRLIRNPATPTLEAVKTFLASLRGTSYLPQ